MHKLPANTGKPFFSKIGANSSKLIALGWLPLAAILLFGAACGGSSLTQDNGGNEAVPEAAEEVGGESGASGGEIGQQSAALVTNGGFESNTSISPAVAPLNWTVERYLNATGVSGALDVPPSALASLNLSANQGTALTYVVGGTNQSQYDPDLGSGESFRFPLYGIRTARINYRNATDSGYGKNKNANVLRQTTTVTEADVDAYDNLVHVRFALAPVLENPAHSFKEQPFYYVEVRNASRNRVIYSAYTAAGQEGVPWHTVKGVLTETTLQWHDWQMVDVAPGPNALAVGDLVEIMVAASGCSLGRHFGRVYLDGVGASLPGPFVSATAPATAVADGNVTYTLTYRNGGATVAVGAQLDVATPLNTTFVSVQSYGANCTTPSVGAAGRLVCSLGNLAAGAAGTLAFTVKIDASATGTVVLGDYAIRAQDLPALLGPPASTTIAAAGATVADIWVSQISKYAAFIDGATYSNPLQIIVENRGSSDVTSGFAVHDHIPAYVESGTWAWSCTGGVAGSKCDGTNQNSSGSGDIVLAPQLPRGGAITIVVTGLKVKTDGAAQTFSNQAAAWISSSVHDPDHSNNSVTTTVPIYASGTLRNLTLTKTGTDYGSVTDSSGYLACTAGTACNPAVLSFLSTESVTLRATSHDGGVFAGWSGACSGTAATCTVDMCEARNVTATFHAPSEDAGAAATVRVYGGNGQRARKSAAYLQPLAVLVADANGLPIAGATVTFTAPSSGASLTWTGGTACTPDVAYCRKATTDATGVARLTPTANATSGDVAVSAAVEGVALPADFALVTVGDPDRVLYIGGGDANDPLPDVQMAAPGARFNAPLRVVVLDENGHGVPGVEVTFNDVPAGGATATLSSPALTDASGQTFVWATANGTANGAGTTECDEYTPCTEPETCFGPLTSSGMGTCGASDYAFTVTASVVGAQSATFYLRNLSQTASKVLAEARGASQVAAISSSFALPLTVTVVDAQGEPVAGAAVTFTAPGSGATATLSGTNPATTDARGRARILATANGTAGAYSVTAEVAGAIAGTFNLVNAGQYLGLSRGSPQSTTAGAAFAAPLVVLVRDAVTGHPAGAGTSVSFAAPVSGASAVITGSPATTDAAGLASVTATANSTTGFFTVTATSGAAAGSADFALENEPLPPASITVAAGSPQSTTVGAAFATALRALVKDASDAPVVGVAVTFSAPGSGASAALSSSVAITDASGIAQVTATANIVAGTYNVTASVNALNTTFALTNNAGAPVSIAFTGGTNQSATVDTAFSAALEARVLDSHGNPVPSQTVTFSVPSSGATAVLSATSASTNASGIAQITATAGTVAGSYVVTAQVNALNSTCNLTNNAGAPAVVTAYQGGSQSTTVASAFATALQARIADAFGNLLSGVEVTFAAPVSGASAVLSSTTANTNASGIAQITATANTTAGSYAVTASVGALTAQFSLGNTPSAPASLVVGGGGSQSAAVATAFAAGLQALLRDVYSNPIAGVTVTFAAPGSGATATLSSTTATTNASGVAAVTATAGTVAGSYTVTASHSTFTADFGLTNNPGTPTSMVASGGSSQSATVDTAFGAALQVTLKDTYNNVVPGVTVTFTAPGSGATAMLSSGTATTNASGVAEVTATAGTVAGSYTVAASQSSLTANFSLTNNVGVPTSLAVTAGGSQSATVNAAFATGLQVTLKDAYNNAISGATVTFTPPGSGATAVLSSSTATTNAAGVAEVTATAGTVAGAYTVTASHSSLTADFNLTNNVGPVASFVASAGGGQSATVNTAFATGLQVTLKDAYNNPISGATVTFTAPSTGARAALSSGTAQSNGSGLASVTATAGTVVGSYVVTASYSGMSATFALTNTVGAVASIAVAAGGTQSAAVETPFTLPLQAVVKDSYNNPISGATVTFAAPGSEPTASLSGTTALTNAAGVAAVTATAGTGIGDYNVVASISTFTAQFAMTNLAPVACTTHADCTNPATPRCNPVSHTCGSNACGDGSVLESEACDDGNVTDSDGCTSCIVDDDFACTGEPSDCYTTLVGVAGVPNEFSLPMAGGEVTFIWTITNNGPVTAVLDSFAVTHDATGGSGTPTIKAGSSEFGGVAVADPTVVGTTITWSGAFAVPVDDGVPGSNSNKRTLRCVMEFAAATAVVSVEAAGFTQSTQFDSTADINDDAPVLSLIQIGTGKDSDGDHVNDLRESYLGTDPDNPDTDGDGLDDEEEIGADWTYTLGVDTNPLNPDTDGDGANDGLDNFPLNPSTCGDQDSDSCDDCANGSYAPNNDGLDSDGDGLCDAGDSDDDGDGWSEGDEALCGTDALSAASVPLDTDGDHSCDVVDSDDDGDEVDDDNDGAPLDAAVCSDIDGDGCNDCTSGTYSLSDDGADADQDGVCDGGDDDDDGDGVYDVMDNCRTTPNADQSDGDADGRGDDCDDDADGDSVANTDDNCPYAFNTSQLDSDAYGEGDACVLLAQQDGGEVVDLDPDGDGVASSVDNCPSAANDAQQDTDGDGTGDVCDTDDDGDGVEDSADNCRLVANAQQECEAADETDEGDPDADALTHYRGVACGTDWDGDDVDDFVDNCLVVRNYSQSDTDQDGLGDACDLDRDGDGVENDPPVLTPDAADTGDGDGDAPRPKKSGGGSSLCSSSTGTNSSSLIVMALALAALVRRWRQSRRLTERTPIKSP